MLNSVAEKGRKLRLMSVITVMALSCICSNAVFAEANEVRLSQEYGLNYLPVQVVIEKKFIDEQARKLGLPNIKVLSYQFGGGSAANDAILSGRVDFNATGIGPLITMWAKTVGGLNVRAALPIAATPTSLVTVDPKIHSLADFLHATDDQIALPAVKVSVQALVLQMASSKAFGQDKAFALDPLTVSMKNPDAFAALKTRSSNVKSHFAIEPFTSMELQESGAREVLSSYNVLGGKHTLTLLWTTEKFKKNNPKLYQAVVNAFNEAAAWISANPNEAASLFVRVSKSPISQEAIEKIIRNKDKMDYSPTPMKTMEFANYMYQVGLIKKKPNSWKDMFWENVYNLPGS